MEISTIAQAKNHLPKLIHAAEAGEDIRISRHGKLVAVLISAERYQQRFATNVGVFQAMQQWRENFGDVELSDAEVDSWRDSSPARENAWD
ncbi:MAG: type II toxin-antitoxin system Phd/YefM family antitoxin [Gallionella sp.]|nr:type II toxin-antitoxin system Phd/YefM family antitoxin [Gallionella sp.]